MSDVPPEEQVARLFMEHKGLGHVEPYNVSKVEGEHCWYFSYQLPEGVLELEVCWEDDEWNTTPFFRTNLWVE